MVHLVAPVGGGGVPSPAPSPPPAPGSLSDALKLIQQKGWISQEFSGRQNDRCVPPHAQRASVGGAFFFLQSFDRYSIRTMQLRDNIRDFF